METKPKKTLSEEQIKKMQLGRKLAYEKKKKERELERNKAKEFVDAKKDKNKEKLLKLEMEALQQQQDRIDNLKIQVERKKEVKSKLKMAKQEEAEPVEQSPREIVERELEIDEPIIEKILDLKEEVEVDMAGVSNDFVGDEKEMPDEKEEEAVELFIPTNDEYREVFNEKASEIRKGIPQPVKKYYDEALKKFDCHLDLDTNITNMIDYVKEVVKTNTEIVNKVRSEQKEKELEKQKQNEIIQKLEAETLAEKEIENRIYKLMKIKY